jgi:hypothetical protein
MPETNIGSAMAIAKVIDGALPMILASFVLGCMAWASWVTWGIRQVNTKMDIAISNQVMLIASEAKTAGELQAHRLEDAANFATIRAERSVLNELLEHAGFWRKIAQDRGSMT